MTDRTPDTAEGRIAQYCEWFDHDLPPLEYEDGEILLTDPLMDWIKESGASFDWIFCGDAKIMAIAHRKRFEEENRIIEASRHLTKPELAIVTESIRASLDNGIDFPVALAACQVAIDVHRAEQVEI